MTGISLGASEKITLNLRQFEKVLFSVFEAIHFLLGFLPDLLHVLIYFGFGFL